MKKKVGKALVVGAGISGIRSALDLAETGYGVTLIDRLPHLGGILSQLDYQFPTDRCGMCKMLPMVARDAASQYCLRKGLFHENIDILLATELLTVAGEAGNFQVTLRQKPVWVDPDRCVGCGVCADVCPVSVPDAFNACLSHHKAIYFPVPHAIPNPYVIDMTACTRCGACESACPTGAIRLTEAERAKFHILVVDDERIIRDSLKAWLHDEEGFSVVTAESGPEALSQLEQQACQLMLLDIKMPGMDGVEVLTRAKEIQPAMAVVMMTAYATVETAVEAMKTGALDYLIKPFNPETLIPKVLEIYEMGELSRTRELTVGALVLCGGSEYYDPSSGKNTLGYKRLPGVVTSLEFERLISGTGPTGGKLVRAEDGKPIEKIAWVQCVGSRDLQTQADFCSNVCCMAAIKEALVAKEKFGAHIDTTIYYMDMRTFGKSYQRYRDRAETERGVRFERGRIHSVMAGESGDLAVRYADAQGAVRDENYHMVVLAVGQRPMAGTAELSDMLGIPLNEWGYCRTEPFSMIRTHKEGIVVGGAYSGLKDIGESVVQASAAAAAASRVIHAHGGSLALETGPEPQWVDVSRELPRILVVACTCDDRRSPRFPKSVLENRLKQDPMVCSVEFVDRTCAVTGWETLEAMVEKHRPNRVLIGACLPYLYARKIRALGRRFGLNPSLADAVDIYTPAASPGGLIAPETSRESTASGMERALQAGLARLKRCDPSPAPRVKIVQRALVVGGGIAGMTAALAIADHGYAVDLVEKNGKLGGNLNWLHHTVEGHETGEMREEMIEKIQKHPLIDVHTQTEVTGSYGAVGHFRTTIARAENQVTTLAHGVVILATGGEEAATRSYGYGKSDAVMTQRELEGKLHSGAIDLRSLSAVVMIQCVDSREASRNYCSRVCCASALKHTLELKEKNPDIAVYILYRDMMSYGFMETYFTRARRAGVLFFQYTPADKPQVTVADPAEGDTPPVMVETIEPILGRRVQISADLLVLSVGVVPCLPAELAASFGAAVDPDGFFSEAESKWRPVDSLAEGVFACGLAHSPRSITEAVATAEAASQRALRILSQEHLPSGNVVASVRHTLCSLCRQCVDACPYHARTVDPEIERIWVNPLQCQGCGACAAVCPNSASVVAGFQGAQMLAVIDAALAGTFNG